VVIQCALSITAAVLCGGAGLTLIALGMSANTLAIMANGGHMPIVGGWSTNPCYTEVDEDTAAVWLCDLLETTETSWASWVVSPGDALECIGLWALAAELVLR